MLFWCRLNLCLRNREIIVSASDVISCLRIYIVGKEVWITLGRACSTVSLIKWKLWQGEWMALWKPCCSAGGGEKTREPLDRSPHSKVIQKQKL